MLQNEGAQAVLVDVLVVLRPLRGAPSMACATSAARSSNGTTVAPGRRGEAGPCEGTADRSRGVAIHEISAGVSVDTSATCLARAVRGSVAASTFVADATSSAVSLGTGSGLQPRDVAAVEP